ncbi:uncharacterized protein [Antedon mediterranea]|uniref:uncharacterized protein n=1 Tax=Antedon mediterranea TaxID=105859 RepID=UPI003AF68B26
MELETQRFQAEMKLALEDHHAMIEMGRQELELDHRRREMELSAKMAKADAVQKVYTEVIETETQPRYHSTPEDLVLPTIHLPSFDGRHLDASRFERNPSKPTEPILQTPKADDPSVRKKSDSPALNTLHQPEELSNTICQMLADSRLHQQSLVEALNLPKNELPMFDGNPLHYWSFIRAFDNAIDRKSTDDGAKLIFLLQFCTGKAKTLLQCCLMKEPAEGYRLAKKLERFGNNDNIAQAWIDKITKRKNFRDELDLQDFADDIRCCQETLESMGYLSELENRRSLYDMVKFITAAAEEANDPIFGKLVRKDRRDKQKQNTSYSAQSIHIPSSKKPEVPPVNPPKEDERCVYCGHNHYVTFCKSFKALRVKDRLAFVQSKRLCVNCFKPGHIGKECLRQITCDIDDCGKKHSKYLHIPRYVTNSPPNPPNPPNSSPHPPIPTVTTAPTTTATPLMQAALVQGNSKFIQANRERVALPIVAVRVRGKDPNSYVDTYALIDTGGTFSYCTEELADRLQVVRQKCTAELTTIEQKNILINTELISLNLSNLENTYTARMPQIIVRHSLNLGLDNLACHEDLIKWPHLADIQLQPILDVTEVQLLIGQDMPELLCPQEVRKGWAINGPINKDVNQPRSSHHVQLKATYEQSLLEAEYK